MLTSGAVAVTLLGVGLALLLAGAEGLVRGAARLAGRVGVAPLAIGLTVVAFATSAPELAITVRAALGAPEEMPIAVGNIVGSNIANILLILGAAALVAPLVVAPAARRRDVPLMVGVSCVVPLLAAPTGAVGLAAGAALLLGLVGYLTWVLRSGRDPAWRETAPLQPPSGTSALREVLLVVGGTGLLVLGAHWMVLGAGDLARTLGFSELVIGLTVVAVGTSLPELATSVLAVWRGQRDLAVGNVVGSNLLNLLAVLGVAGVLTPGGIAVPAVVFRVDLPVMIAAAALCWLLCARTGRIGRGWGGVLLGLYAVYLGGLYLGYAWGYS